MLSYMWFEEKNRITSIIYSIILRSVTRFPILSIHIHNSILVKSRQSQFFLIRAVRALVSSDSYSCDDGLHEYKSIRFYVSHRWPSGDFDRYLAVDYLARSNQVYAFWLQIGMSSVSGQSTLFMTSSLFYSIRFREWMILSGVRWSQVGSTFVCRF